MLSLKIVLWQDKRFQCVLQHYLSQVLLLFSPKITLHQKEWVHCALPWEEKQCIGPFTDRKKVSRPPWIRSRIAKKFHDVCLSQKSRVSYFTANPEIYRSPPSLAHNVHVTVDAAYGRHRAVFLRRSMIHNRFLLYVQYQQYQVFEQAANTPPPPVGTFSCQLLTSNTHSCLSVLQSLLSKQLSHSLHHQFSFFFFNLVYTVVTYTTL